MAWRAAGVYGDPVRRERLLGYYRSLPASVRAEAGAGARVRFYRAEVWARPEAWREPPASLMLLDELVLD